MDDSPSRVVDGRGRHGSRSGWEGAHRGDDIRGWRAAILSSHCTDGGAQRDDVARALALLADRPEADGLGIDINGGDEKIEDGLARVIRRRASDFDP